MSDGILIKVCCATSILRSAELGNSGRRDKVAGVTLKRLCGNFFKSKRPNIRAASLEYLMGHSNAATTLKHYQQMAPASAAQAVLATDALLGAAAGSQRL